MTTLSKLFDNLDEWRHLPAYQLERRADIFFSLYLPELLQEKYGFQIHGLVPEFPLHKRTLYPQEGTNRSVKVDYLAKVKDRDAVVLVELKTDDSSIDPEQDQYLERAREVGLAALLRGLEPISQTTKKRRKYRCLRRKLADVGLIAIDSGGRIRPRTEAYDLDAVYLLPNADESGKEIITFHQAAEVIERHGDALSRRFAASLREWAEVTAGDPSVRVADPSA